MSEIVTDPFSSSAINVRFGETLRRRLKSDREIQAFQELTLNDSRAIREAINSGRRSFNEFLPVLEKAEKFKGWLSKVNPDVGHLTNYYQRVCEGTWLDALPAKLARFSIFSAIGAGLGLLIPGADVASGAADTFLLDKLLKGWTPNQFIKTQFGTVRSRAGLTIKEAPSISHVTAFYVSLTH